MPATTTATARRRLVIASIAEAVCAVALLAAVLAGAPAWEIVVLAVLFADAAAIALWQLRVVRRRDRDGRLGAAVSA